MARQPKLRHWALQTYDESDSVKYGVQCDGYQYYKAFKEKKKAKKKNLPY